MADRYMKAPPATSQRDRTPANRSSSLQAPRGLLLQRKSRLEIGAPDDPSEREADRVASQALAGPAHPALRVSRPASLQVARQQPAGRQGDAPPSVDRVLGEPGIPLSPVLRHDMERRFGHDFSRVRVHLGAAAEQSAHEVDARAYAVGRDVVFGAGQYAPASPEGRRLIAHELTHTLQQNATPGPRLIQRDLAVEPPAANPAAVTLTPANVQRAVRLNSIVFTDAAEIEVVRDVLGIPKAPAVVDEDFVNAVVRYQGGLGVTADGMVGATTAGRLAQEITAEADALADPATGTPLRRVARRLHLRSMTSRRHGTLTHQGFVGPDDNPEGAVTVRAGDPEGGGDPNISLEYTGENSDAVDWLQFINMQMFATPAGAPAPVFNAGAVGTTGGNVIWSDNLTTHWFVDAVPPPASASPLYNASGFLNTRAAGRRLAMFDAPGGASGLPVAQGFAAAGAPAAGATTVRMRMRFDSYVIRNNRARYHVSWSATTTYDVVAGTASDIVYAQGSAGAVAGLQAVHRTALLAEYAGNAIH